MLSVTLHKSISGSGVIPLTCTHIYTPVLIRTECILKFVKIIITIKVEHNIFYQYQATGEKAERLNFHD